MCYISTHKRKGITMTVKMLIKKLSKLPQDAEVLAISGEDSRDNICYDFLESIEFTTAGELDNELISMSMTDEEKVVILHTED